MDVKTCKVCGQSKAVTDFHADRRAKDGLQRACKECQKISISRWRKENPAAYREIEARSRAKNREKRIAAMRARYAANPGPHKAQVRRNWKRMKDQVYSRYGGYVCRCCGETETTFLCLDHVNNDGYKHRKVVTPDRLYKWLLDNDCPPIVQVLCFNCNQGKRLNGGICPHQTNGKADKAE